jgi:hypothetical protein
MCFVSHTYKGLPPRQDMQKINAEGAEIVLFLNDSSLGSATSALKFLIAFLPTGIAWEICKCRNNEPA